MVTDSFHGTCFATIFEKPFFSFVNRQPDRFRVFDKWGNLSERIFNPDQEIPFEKMAEKPDYELVREELCQERKRSLQWLESALDNIPKK